jgi:uncharacterized protein YndB with AHSA1/START domain
VKAHQKGEQTMTATIHQIRRVPIPPEQAFRHFTQNELLEAFFTVKADVEPKVGGKYEQDWDPKTTPEQATIGCRITALSNAKLLAFEWKGPPPHARVMNNADPLTQVTLSFFPVGDPASPHTQVHVLHSGWGSGDAWRAARDYFDRAWGQVLDALDSHLRSAERQPHGSASA